MLHDVESRVIINEKCWTQHKESAGIALFAVFSNWWWWWHRHTHTQRQARVAGTISEKENEKNVLDQNVNGKEVNRVIYFWSKHRKSDSKTKGSESNNWSCWFFDLSLVVPTFFAFRVVCRPMANFDPFLSSLVSPLLSMFWSMHGWSSGECKRHNVLLSWKKNVFGLLIEKLRASVESGRWIFVLSVECNMLCYRQYARTNCFP